MPGEDKMTTRLVQRELGRRPIDVSRLSVSASHGVVFLRGTVRPVRGHDIDLKQELEIVCRVLRTKPGIREVHAEDVTIR